MTTTVKQGSGRPAAAAKTAKAAQNTPLPPKSTESTNAEYDRLVALPLSQQTKKVQARIRVLGNLRENTGEGRDAAKTEVTETKPYGEMTAGELKAEYTRLTGNKASSRWTKGQVMDEVLKAVKDARAAAKVDALLAPSASDVEIEKALPLPSDAQAELNKATIDPTTKSGAKALAFVAEAERLGWTVANNIQEDEELVIDVARGSESISIEWIRGVFTGEGYYSHSGRTPIKLRNVSAAKQRMAMAPAQADAEAAKVTAHKAVRGAVRKPGSAKGKLPFDVETATDDEVVAAVGGKKISWTNSISGETETTRATGTVTVKADRSGRSLSFTDASGFRSVRIASLVSVR